MSVLEFIGGIFKPLTQLVDDVHFSGEEKGEFRLKLVALQSDLTFKMMEYEAKLMEAQSSIIKAEAKSGNWLTSSWRPVTMYTFLVLIVSWWLGYTPPNATEELVKDLFTLIKIGLGGYIVGRSAEKVAPAIVGMIRGTK